MRKIIKYFSNIFILILVIMAVLSAFSLAGWTPAYKPITVLTGSMNPKINAGDIAVVKYVLPSTVRIGDIITFKADRDILITHRVVSIIKKEGSLYFKTKGDANNVEDADLVQDQAVIGKVAARIPLLGYAASFIASKVGLVIFIIIPSLVLISGEIKTILSELKNRNKLSKSNKDNVEI